MNQYQEIIDEVYNKYKTEIENSLDENSESPEEAEFFKSGLVLSKEDFIDEIKTDEEFAKKWGLKIEERLLTWEEQVQWVMKNTDVELENLYIVEEVAKKTTPTRLVTVTYKDKVVVTYE